MRKQMKDNKLSILIKKPIQAVFEFAINPKNTSSWVDTIMEEQTNEWPIKVGTIYRNMDKSGIWSEYNVVELVENELFTLASTSSDYQVRYSFAVVEYDKTELEYHEWTNQSQLEAPLSQVLLDKLKTILEA